MLVSTVSLTTIFNNSVPNAQRARWTRPTPQPDLVSGATESAATPLKKWEKRWSRKKAVHRVRPCVFLVLPRGLVVGNNKNRSRGNRPLVMRVQTDLLLSVGWCLHRSASKHSLSCVTNETDVYIFTERQETSRKHKTNTCVEKEELNRLGVIKSPYCSSLHMTCRSFHRKHDTTL